jgi:hypothetical protein
MKKKKSNLNKFALASVAAVIAVPAVASAAGTFPDVVEKNSHAPAIYNLAERGIISGFEDGTYRPNAVLTRGQAAKILAQVLELDTTSTDSLFIDVPSTHQYAGAINALAKAGIVSGYADGTFKPSMPLTRGQMAKILVEGFGFEESAALTHSFKDVSLVNGYRYYIQTLLDLGITIGTSSTTFSPTEAVKRGQMATFVVRAEAAKALIEEEATTDDSATVTPTPTSTPPTLWTPPDDSDDLDEEVATKDSVIIKAATFSDDKLYIDGLVTTVDAALLTVLKNPTNSDALTEGSYYLSVNIVDGVAKSIHDLSIGKSNAVFDAQGLIITGKIEIDGTNITIKNAIVNGNVIIRPSSLNANIEGVDVKGKLIVGELDAPTTARSNYFASLSMEPFVASSNTLRLTNTTIDTVEVYTRDVVIDSADLLEVSKLFIFAEIFRFNAPLATFKNVYLEKVARDATVIGTTIDAVTVNISTPDMANLQTDRTGVLNLVATVDTITLLSDFEYTLKGTSSVGTIVSDYRKLIIDPSATLGNPIYKNTSGNRVNRTEIIIEGY